MIIKTKIDWLQTKKLSEYEQAKREVVGDDFKDDTDPYEEAEKDAVIDTGNDKMYIQIEPDKICMIRLLDAQYLYSENGQLERIEERLMFKSDLETIYNELTQKK